MGTLSPINVGSSRIVSKQDVIRFLQVCPSLARRDLATGSECKCLIENC